LAQNLLVDVFGKQQGAFWVARRAETSSRDENLAQTAGA
jgi:hypothetical protein